MICTIGNIKEIIENIWKIKVDMLESMIESFKYIVVVVFFLEKTEALK